MCAHVEMSLQPLVPHEQLNDRPNRPHYFGLYEIEDARHKDPHWSIGTPRMSQVPPLLRTIDKQDSTWNEDPQSLPFPPEESILLFRGGTPYHTGGWHMRLRLLSQNTVLYEGPTRKMALYVSPPAVSTGARLQISVQPMGPDKVRIKVSRLSYSGQLERQCLDVTHSGDKYCAVLPDSNELELTLSPIAYYP